MSGPAGEDTGELTGGELPVLARLAVRGRTVAEEVDGAGLDPTLSPRPFLHPVATRAGVVVTAARPADHPWHLGVGVAVQDVDGVNLWGGRTYVRGEGYRWRADHGTIRQQCPTASVPDGFTERLLWCAPTGRALLGEVREVRGRPVPAKVAPDAWRLDLSFTLTAAGSEPVRLGSPATNGRPGAGYGGFFWRLPPLHAAVFRTAGGTGEDAVHGSTDPWLAVTGQVQGRTITLVAAPDDGADPWFVRQAGYPGFGLSLAAERPVTIRPGAPLRRVVRVVVADGAPAPDRLASYLTALGTAERIDR